MAKIATDRQDHPAAAPLYFTATEVAHLLGLSPRTIRLYCQRGYFPTAFRLNPHSPASPWAIPPTDVTAFLRQRTARPCMT
jgi:hypothetical protein